MSLHWINIYRASSYEKLQPWSNARVTYALFLEHPIQQETHDNIRMAYSYVQCIPTWNNTGQLAHFICKIELVRICQRRRFINPVLFPVVRVSFFLLAFLVYSLHDKHVFTLERNVRIPRGTLFIFMHIFSFLPFGHSEKRDLRAYGSKVPFVVGSWYHLSYSPVSLHIIPQFQCRQVPLPYSITTRHVEMAEHPWVHVNYL